jgi:hypothetical protein
MNRLYQCSTEGLRHGGAWHPSVDGQQHLPNQEGSRILGKYGPGTSGERYRKGGSSVRKYGRRSIGR